VSREPLAERRAQPITGIRQYAAKTYTGRDRPIDLGEVSAAGGKELNMLRKLVVAARFSETDPRATDKSS
jgi:hypothetical protein